MPIDRKQLPRSADVLQQMVLDLIAQLDASEARRIKTENLLRQLLAARSGRRLAKTPETVLTTKVRQLQQVATPRRVHVAAAHCLAI